MLTTLLYGVMGQTSDQVSITIEDSNRVLTYKNAIYVDDSTIQPGMQFLYASQINFDGDLYLTPDDTIIWWITQADPLGRGFKNQKFTFDTAGGLQIGYFESADEPSISKDNPPDDEEFGDLIGKAVYSFRDGSYTEIVSNDQNDPDPEGAQPQYDGVPLDLIKEQEDDTKTRLDFRRPDLIDVTTIPVSRLRTLDLELTSNNIFRRLMTTLKRKSQV